MKKVCTICKVEKDLEDFYKENRASDGRRCRCKECTKKYNNKYYVKNADAIKERVNKWTENNYDYRIEYKRDWNDNHRDEISNYNKKYRQTEEGMIQHRKGDAIRRREMKYIELFSNPFDCEVDYHHVNNLLVIPIPKEIHKSTHRGHDVDEHRKLCNKWIEKIYCIDIEEIILPKKENKKVE